MKYKKIVLFILFLVNFSCASSQTSPASDCSSEFNKVGIRDFEVGISLQDLKKKNPLLVLKQINDDVDLYDDYMFKEYAKINGLDKEVIYYFNVQEGMVLSYFFEVEGDILFFNQLAEKLKDGKFVDLKKAERKYYFFEKNNFCYKYFRLKIKTKEKMVITGGLSHSNL